MKPVAWIAYDEFGDFMLEPTPDGDYPWQPLYIAPRELSDKAEQLYDDLCDAWQSDMEHGVKCLNEKAVDDFKNNYPELNVMISRFMSFLNEISDIKESE